MQLAQLQTMFVVGDTCRIRSSAPGLDAASSRNPPSRCGLPFRRGFNGAMIDGAVCIPRHTTSRHLYESRIAIGTGRVMPPWTYGTRGCTKRLLPHQQDGQFSMQPKNEPSKTKPMRLPLASRYCKPWCFGGNSYPTTRYYSTLPAPNYRFDSHKPARAWRPIRRFSYVERDDEALQNMGVTTRSSNKLSTCTVVVLDSSLRRRKRVAGKRQKAGPALFTV